MRTVLVRYVACILLLAFCSASKAGWHSGKVSRIAFPYEGNRPVFLLAGFTPTCSCPGYWTGYMCLNEARATHAQEYAFLLSAKARDVVIYVNINETTCLVTSMYE